MLIDILKQKVPLLIFLLLCQKSLSAMENVEGVPTQAGRSSRLADALANSAVFHAAASGAASGTGLAIRQNPWSTVFTILGLVPQHPYLAGAAATGAAALAFPEEIQSALAATRNKINQLQEATNQVVAQIRSSTANQVSSLAATGRRIKNWFGLYNCDNLKTDIDQRHDLLRQSRDRYFALVQEITAKQLQVATLNNDLAILQAQVESVQNVGRANVQRLSLDQARISQLCSEQQAAGMAVDIAPFRQVFAPTSFVGRGSRGVE